MFACSRMLCKGWASATVGTYRTIFFKSYLYGITQTSDDISVHQTLIRRKDKIPNPTSCMIGHALLVDTVIIGKIQNLLLRNVKAKHEILLLLTLFYERYLLRIS